MDWTKSGMPEAAIFVHYSSIIFGHKFPHPISFFPRYIRDNGKGDGGIQTHPKSISTNLAANAFERMSSILAMASLISTLKSVANERVQISSIFNLIEFDVLIKDVHSSDLDGLK